MRLYSYKNFPTINLDRVLSFGVDEQKKCVYFQFSNHCVHWFAESVEEANNIYNAIIDSLSKEYQNHTHII